MKRVGVFLLFGLAACGGGGGPSVADPTPREPIVPIVPDVAAPLTGIARYAGPLELGFNPPTAAAPVSLTGELAVTIDFDRVGEAVTGSASDFSDGVDAYQGELYLSAGALDESGGDLAFGAQLSGSLRADTSSYLVFGQIGGEVLGENQDAISGDVRGTVRQSGFDAPLAGQFQAARRP